MLYSRTLERTHTSWACAHNHALDNTCPESCLCECHETGHAHELRRRGIHVHDWKVKVYLLQGSPDKLSIRCMVCSMSIPRDAKPQVVQP